MQSPVFDDCFIREYLVSYYQCTITDFVYTCIISDSDGTWKDYFIKSCTDDSTVINNQWLL